MADQALPDHRVLTPGTQIVTRVAVENVAGKIAHPQGAVGLVVKALGDDEYQVRFLDSYEDTFRRSDLAIRKHHQREGLHEPAASETDLYDYVIYRCIVGSRAYGLAEEDSDVDRRGFYLPPADLHWSLFSIPEQLEDKETEECYWELQKFLTLALKANPNILECLYTPLVELATPLAQELLDSRAIFLSKLIYQTYNGYVLSQFRKLNKHLEKHGRIKWKHAMHLIRLLLSGITILEEGFVPVRLDEHREELLAIRRGQRSWSEVDAWRLRLHEEFDAAFADTDLPEQPDYEAANAFLVQARRSMV